MSRWFFIALLVFAFSALEASPAISVEPGRIALGAFPANEAQVRSVTITNSGDEVLNLSEVRSSCGCAAGTLDRTRLEPGESTSLSAEILPESIAGPFSKSLFIRSDDPAVPVRTVTLSGNSVPLVRVYPQQMVYAGALPRDAEWRYEFRLETSRPVVWGEAAVAGFEGAAVELAESEDEDNLYFLTVRVEAPERDGAFRLEAVLPVVSPENWKPVKFLLHGRFGPPAQGSEEAP